MNQERPCYVNNRKAIFHRFIDIRQGVLGEDGLVKDMVQNTVALVEFDNGAVDMVMPDAITFKDTGDFDKRWGEKAQE